MTWVFTLEDSQDLCDKCQSDKFGGWPDGVVALCYHRTQQTLMNDNNHHDDTMIVHDNQYFENDDYD